MTKGTDPVLAGIFTGILSGAMYYIAVVVILGKDKDPLMASIIFAIVIGVLSVILGKQRQKKRDTK